MKNILIIHVDELYHGDLGCTGSTSVRTPNIDALAREGVLFTNANAVNGVCVPSRASLLTGRYPMATGVVSNEHVLPSNEDLMCRTFQAAGYRTGYFGKTHYGRPDNEMEAQGWEESFIWQEQYNRFLQDHDIAIHYPERSEIKWPEMRYWNVGTSRIPAPFYFENVIADHAIDFIRRDNNAAPFLCFVGNIAPHGPFSPPQPYDRMYDPDEVELLPRLDEQIETLDRPEYTLRWIRQNRRYTNERECRLHAAATHGLISLVDDNVGRLIHALKEAGVYDNTIIVFTSDHGDFRSKYGIIGKSWCMDECLLRTPLIVVHPDCRHPGGRRSEALLENVDIYPTLLACTGLEIPRNVQGRSFHSLLADPTAQHRSESHAYQWSFDRTSHLQQSVIRRGPWKLVQSDGFKGELYNLQEDPWEVNNLVDSPEQADLLADLRNSLLRWHLKHSGGCVDWQNTGFWEDRTAFYDESRFPASG